MLALPIYGLMQVEAGYRQATRSEVQSRILADDAFGHFCRREGIDCSPFQGPRLTRAESGDASEQFDYVWVESPTRCITVSVIYHPTFDIDVTASFGLVPLSTTSLEQNYAGGGVPADIAEAHSKACAPERAQE